LISGDFVGGRDNGFTATNTSAAATNWAHVVCTYDGTNWNLYVNAALVATNADAQGASLFADPWAIGNGTSGGAARYFNGNICQVALYTNSLTPTRVAAHYAVGMYGTSNLAPTISSQPHNLREVTNTTATFTVVAVAFPLPTYQWYTVIGGATNAIGGATSAIYTTAPVQANDTGNGYFVVVSNSLGSIASEVAILTAGQMETAPGFLEADEYFGNYNIASVAFGALYPQDSSLPTPDKVEYLKTLNDNADLPNGGGERIYGWFTPPVTGNYVFFDASDDAGVLWLSTNKDPVNVYEIAQNQAWMYSGSDGATDWTDSNAAGGEYTYLSTGEWRSDLFELGGGQNAFAYATPTGAWSAWPGLNPDGSIPLTAGTPYYIELDHWQNSGGQGAAVTYKLDGNPDPSTGAASLLTGNVISATVPDNVAPVPPPLINQITISGSSVSVSGNNGLVNAQFNVLESTNLSAPLTTWTIITTQRFDQSGAFHFTNTVQAGSPQQFFMIKVPTN
jgi:hypothetical protein